MEIVYKILTPRDWKCAQGRGVFEGSAADVLDGYIHFSTANQVAETVARHYSAAGELVLLAVRTECLGRALRWEASRGGALFPHLYGPLRVTDILWAETFDARRLTDIQDRPLE